jgi:hypothetical protein
MYYTAQQRGCVLVKTLNSHNEETAIYNACEVVNDLLDSTTISIEGFTMTELREELKQFDIEVIEHDKPFIAIRIAELY